MKVLFDYNQEKDVWCILNYGKSSNNSSEPTKVYKKLISEYGENPTNQNAIDFIEKYISENNINIEDYINNYQNDWDSISEEYIKRAEKIFKISLPKDVTAYLTINNRCPYDIFNNLFFANFPSSSIKIVVMHELWHFYTWYKFGIIWEEKLGKQKYNDLKESLTVLLNIECKDLMPEGDQDYGYPQHKELREKITQLWNETTDIEKLWSTLAQSLH